MNETNTRNNLTMSSIDAKGLEFLNSRLQKNPNAKFVILTARINATKEAYIGTGANGKQYINIPVVADYMDKAAKYAGLSSKEDGQGLFFNVSAGGKLGERLINLVNSGKLRAGATVVVSGTTDMRTSADGKYENAMVYAASFDVSFWGKKENKALAVKNAAGTAASAPAAPAQTAYPAADFSLIDDDEDLPF